MVPGHVWNFRGIRWGGLSRRVTDSSPEDWSYATCLFTPVNLWLAPLVGVS